MIENYDIRLPPVDIHIVQVVVDTGGVERTYIDGMLKKPDFNNTIDKAKGWLKRWKK